MELMRCLILGENNLIIRGHTLSFRRKLNSGCWRKKKQSQTILKLINKELCFLSLIYDYNLSYSNCPVWSDNGNQPLMNAIKYNTTSILRLPRDLSVLLQQWLKTEKQIQITLYYLCPNYHKQDANCYRKLKKKKWLISTRKTF